MNRKHPWLFVLIAVNFLCAWLPLIPSLFAFNELEVFLKEFDGRSAKLLWRSIWIASSTSILSLLIGWPLGIMLGRFEFMGRTLLKTILPLACLMPPLMVAQAWHGILGISGPWAAVFSLGCGYASIPALLIIQSLNFQSQSSYESARLIDFNLTIKNILRHTKGAAMTGAAISFIFTIGDFAVPDYFATVGELFHVYSSEVFGNSRDANFALGAVSNAPLMLIGLGVFFLILPWIRQENKAPIQYAERHAPSRPVLMSIFSFSFMSLILFAILIRIIFETGIQGPLSTSSWIETSKNAFSSAIELGRSDILRTFQYAGFGALITFLCAPLWAFIIQNAGNKWKIVILGFTGIPLLMPSLSIGFGSILVFNQPGWEGFYHSVFLPGLLIAGRFMIIAILIHNFTLNQRAPSIDESARLHKLSLTTRVFNIYLKKHFRTAFLASALVFVFAIRELDFAILLPAANQSAAVRYYNALHFSRDNFVAAFGLILCLLAFLPILLHNLVKRND